MTTPMNPNMVEVSRRPITVWYRLRNTDVFDVAAPRYGGDLAEVRLDEVTYHNATVLYAIPGCEPDTWAGLEADGLVTPPDNSRGGRFSVPIEYTNDPRTIAWQFTIDRYIKLGVAKFGETPSFSGRFVTKQGLQ
jgi:hypothetical protein